MAGHHRPLFYLTGERRIGDCMEDSLAAAESLRAMPWYTQEDGSLRVRTGPDWAALVSGWMTAYERTLDPVWREKIETGIADLSAAPLGLTSGPLFGFDPETSHLHYIGEESKGSMHLQACMGETEVWLETADMLENAAFADMVARNGRYFFLSAEQRAEESKGMLGGRQFGSPIYSAEMQAWAAHESKDAAMAQSIWRKLLSLLYSAEKPEGFKPVPYGVRAEGSALLEIPWVTTNFTAQWCLKVMVTEALIPDSKPKTFAELNDQLRKPPPEYGLYGA